MKTKNYHYAFIILGILLVPMLIHPQEKQFNKENHNQSLLQKYSLQINQANEDLSLRTSTSQHFKVDKNFYVAIIYSNPAHYNYSANSIEKIAADTTIVAPSSGRVYKQGTSLTKYDNGLRIQNTDNYGCENGYRSWVKFNLSSFRDSTNVVWVEQHIYCTELHEGFFDYLNYDIHRVDNYPDTADAFALWNDIYDGALYEAGEWVSNPPDWEWCLLDPPAAANLTTTIKTDDWFGLGYMVKCDEDDGDYYAVFKGAQDDLPPYLVIGYNYATDVEYQPAMVETYVLYQNYPNPFNPNTIIRYQLPSASYIELKVFDVLGREVANLISEEQISGMYEVEFNAAGLPSGFYIYRIQAVDPSSGSGTGFIQSKKMILLK